MSAYADLCSKRRKPAYAAKSPLKGRDIEIIIRLADWPLRILWPLLANRHCNTEIESFFQ